jgi:hypothetical protein
MKESTYAVFQDRTNAVVFVAESVLDNPTFAHLVKTMGVKIGSGLTKEEAVALSKLKESANDSE